MEPMEPIEPTEPTEPVESYIPPPSKTLSFFRSLLPPFLYAIVIQGLAIYMFVMPDLIAAYEETGILPNSDVNTIGSAPHFPHALLFGALASIILFQFMLTRNAGRFPIRLREARSAVVPYVLLVSLAGNYAFTSGITAVQLLLHTNLPTSTLDGIGENTDLFLLLFTSSVVVPVAEELCFRALTMNYLRRSFPFMRANLIQAAIFGVVHGTPIAIGYAFVFGLFLGWIYHRTGRLSVAILSHIAFNSASLFLGFIPGIDTLLENAFQLTVFLFIPSLLCVLLGLAFLRKAFPRER
jgi:membrane protease YdiL (CAAX protease family)